jgi:hypothetical protein
MRKIFEIARKENIAKDGQRWNGVIAAAQT